jgi:hypothetical protein
MHSMGEPDGNDVLNTNTIGERGVLSFAMSVSMFRDGRIGSGRARRPHGICRYSSEMITGSSLGYVCG